MRLIYHDLWLQKSDFIGLGTSELLCEVTAEIRPGPDGFYVQVKRVTALGYSSDLAGLLKHETEERLCALMLTYYLNSARTGLEGDVPDLTA